MTFDCLAHSVIIIIIMMIIIIAAVSIVLYLYNKGEHTAVYKINKTGYTNIKNII